MGQAICTLVSMGAEMEITFTGTLLREEVLGDPAEIESIFVSNGDIQKEIEAEAIVKGMGDSEGLRLLFWTDTPSGKYEELADIKTQKMSKGDETSYKAKIKAKEPRFKRSKKILQRHQ
jgi:hypothetical protein